MSSARKFAATNSQGSFRILSRAKTQRRLVRSWPSFFRNCIVWSTRTGAAARVPCAHPYLACRGHETSATAGRRCLAARAGASSHGVFVSRLLSHRSRRRPAAASVRRRLRRTRAILLRRASKGALARAQGVLQACGKRGRRERPVIRRSVHVEALVPCFIFIVAFQPYYHIFVAPTKISIQLSKIL